jgi:hypothetical protein
VSHAEVVFPDVPVIPTDAQLGGRVAVEARGRLRHRGPHVLDFDLRHARARGAA